MPNNNRNRNRRESPNNRGFVAGLSPEGQINKLIADQNNLKGGHDLRNWSVSARKELAPSLTITIQVDQADKTHDVQFPKLAFLAASPAFLAHMRDNVEATKLGFVHKDVSLESVKAIAKWLRKVCREPEVPELPMPQDLGNALKLRLTARTLGMHQYVEHIEDRYVKGVADRVPRADEIHKVVDNTRDKDKNDAVLVALANRLSYLCRFHKVSQEEEIAYANLLAKEKFGRLVEAVQEDMVKAMAQRPLSSN